jgi:type VII secretion protein EccB
VAPHTPATRDQVDAYRFGLRRLEAALVRGDPVPVHEQVRAQRRAVGAGVVLGVLGLAVALVLAVAVPRPAWQHHDLLIARPSGGLYVVAHDPDRLVPVANAVAGRLVLAALRSAPVLTEPVPVDDQVLVGAPRTPAAAVSGAVGVDPRGRIGRHWAVCDEVTPTRTLIGTTVSAGPTGAAGGGDVLLTVPGGGTWLVTGGRRHRIDPEDGAARSALGLAGRAPRPASAGLVSALPEGIPLVTPVVPRAGAPGPPGLGRRVGDMVVSRRAGAAPGYHVVLDGGLQEVPPLVADVLVAEYGRPVTEVGAEVVAALPALRRVDLAGWPAAAPVLREPAEAPATCWTWSGAPGADPVGAVHLGTMPPAGPVVALAGADGAGPALDAVAVGAGGAVRATGPGVPPGAGTVWLVSASGVAHGVADEPTAAALGIADPAPAPEAVLRLLPVGPVLDVGPAARAVDVPMAGWR